MAPNILVDWKASGGNQVTVIPVLVKRNPGERASA
jgi:hypothetical protein